jgi:hypothetical protein
MSIYKLNSSLPTSQKLELLNDMILELNGKISKGQFDKKELDQIFNDLPSATILRKYFRDISLGHTLSTYTGWTHVHAESGYSIWKFFPAGYIYNIDNELYVDNKVFENRGSANSETATTFDKVFLYNGDSGTGYTDNTTEAGTEAGTSFEVMDSIEDYLYVGLSTTFGGVSFEFETRGSNYTLDVEYWNETVWTTIDRSGQVFVDDTSNFESDGRIYWDIPTNWVTNSVNGQTKYWIRISTTKIPVTTGKAYLIVPANSVTNLLKLSSAEILNEDWAWCSYNNGVYVTFRNTGKSAYEGNYYISTSSSSINKQNYFIANHHVTCSYQRNSY